MIQGEFCFQQAQGNPSCQASDAMHISLESCDLLCFICASEGVHTKYINSLHDNGHKKQSLMNTCCHSRTKVMWSLSCLCQTQCVWFVSSLPKIYCILIYFGLRSIL